MYSIKLTKIYKKAPFLLILCKGDIIIMKILSFFASFFASFFESDKIKIDKSRKVLFVLKQRQNYDEQKEKIIKLANLN